MIETGHLAAFLALAASSVQTWYGLRGNRPMAARMAVSALCIMSISFFFLIMAFVGSDFSVALVAQHSHTLKPLIYKVAGTWGNHEGSMALWCLVVIGFSVAGALRLQTGRPEFEARALGVQGAVATGSLAYLLFASNPFLRLNPAPLQGLGLNPLLQDPALAIHPPMLYLGYVGFSFVFALAAAGLIEGRIDRHWAQATRQFVLAAWVPLTIGIALGAYWAYYELGWGGWWFWDPVENASLMPWLLGSALLHSIIVTEKRGSFAAWTALLAVLAFCFSLLGAFLVRSGILTSVHAFAVDPLRGSLLLTGLLLYGGAALALFAWRAPALKGGPAWGLVSREGALMLNNLVLAVATLTVLIGTLFPLLAEMTGRQMSVGAPYFNLTFSPLLGALLVTLPLVQHWSWGRMSLDPNWPFAAILGAIFGAIILAGWVLFDLPLGASAGVGLGIWLLYGAGRELFRRAITPGRVFKLPVRVWGMSLAHAGLGLFIIGAVIETGASYERTIALGAGDSAEIAGWTLTLNEVRSGEGPNWYSDESSLRATSGRSEAVLTPSKRYYPAARMPTTETAILKTLRGDLYAALGDRRVVNGRPLWTFRVYFNPLIDLIFLGVTLMALGGGMAMVSTRKSKALADQNGETAPKVDVPEIIL
ncbi:MAG: heme lyase CcmF/NrfE family subunit [Pseudomonadota bacterium]